MYVLVEKIGLIVFFDIPTIPALFAGAALTATSIGITAKVISGKEYSKELKIKMSAINPEDKGELVEAIAL